MQQEGIGETVCLRIVMRGTAQTETASVLGYRYLFLLPASGKTEIIHLNIVRKRSITMKKSTIRKMIAAALATAAIASSAVLFTGCGKSEQERAAEAIQQAMQSDLAVISSAAEEMTVATTKPKEHISLKGFRKEIVDSKQYTVVFDADSRSDFPRPKFYLEVSSPVQADGFTFTKKTEEKCALYGDTFSSDWDISKNGVKFAECTLETIWKGFDKPNVFQLQVNAPESASYTDEADVVFETTEINNFDINIPEALTEAEAKQKVAELESLINENTPTGEYKDKNLKPEGIYYFKGKQGEETLRGVYSYDTSVVGIFYLYVDGTYPFDDNGTVKAFNWSHQTQAKMKEMNNWIKLK